MRHAVGCTRVVEEQQELNRKAGLLLKPVGTSFDSSAAERSRNAASTGSTVRELQEYVANAWSAIVDCLRFIVDDKVEMVGKSQYSWYPAVFQDAFYFVLVRGEPGVWGRRGKAFFFILILALSAAGAMRWLATLPHTTWRCSLSTVGLLNRFNAPVP